MLVQDYQSRKINVQTFFNYTFLTLIITQSIWISVLRISNIYTTIAVSLILSIFFALLAKQNYLKLMKTPPVLFWAIWVIYNYVNWKMIGIVNSDNPLQFVLASFVYPIMTMSIVYFEGRKNLRKTTLVVLVALAIYVMLGLLLQSDNGLPSNALGDSRDRSILGNELPLNACMMTFFAVVANTKGWISKKWLIALLAISLASIFFVATRKALGGWGIIVAMSFFTGFKLNKPSNFLKVLFLLVAFYLAYNYVMEDTYLGERLADTEEQGEESNQTNVKELNYLGDRAMQYALGWELFLENPISGIGLQNFQVVADFPFMIHSEYIVQICECGLIGAILYFLFMGGIMVKVVKNYNKKNSKVFFVCMGGILCILFINFTGWTYQGNAYFAMYGLILAVCYHEKKKKLELAIPSNLK